MDIKFNITKKYTINGKEYNSPDEMPEDARNKLEKALLDSSLGITKKYKSIDEMPEDIRKKYETALKDSSPNNVFEGIPVNAAKPAVLAPGSEIAKNLNYLAIFFVLLCIVVYYYEIIFNIKTKNALLILLFLLPYCLGTIIEINCLPDTSKPSEYSVKVLDKWVQYEDIYFRYYGLFVTPWKESKQSNYVELRKYIGVKKAFYDKVNENDTLSISERNGCLNIPWYAVSLP